VAPDRLTILSRGGVEQWYADIAGRYVDLFDLLPPDELAAGNETRQARDEAGGRKQSRRGELDDLLLRRAAPDSAAVLHPSLLFRLFRDVWQGNLPLDFLFTRADFMRLAKPPRPALAGLPSEYVAVKFYSGTATPDTPYTREALRRLVRDIAARTPVVVLDTGLAVDDHRDYAFGDIRGVQSARAWMTPRTNLGLQSAIVAHARYFVGTCGGLAWLAPFMGVPTVAVYADDALLRPHLTIARQAGAQVGAAEFASLDLRALRRLDGNSGL
jgi:ADP-heptose:LPS heptosyltransferase